MRTRLPVLSALTVLLAGCSSGGAYTGGKPVDSSSPASSGGGGGGGSAALTIQSFSFHPSALTVAPGATVTVTNLDGSDHTVTSTKAGAFSTDAVSKGKPVTFTAPTAAGTYTYVCSFHASMHGTLIVTGG